MTRLNPLSMPTLAPLSLTARARRRAPTGPPLDPEEERSLLQSGVGMLQSLGRVLDKPGSAARGVIHGLTDLAQGDRTPEWGGGLLNALPFSDTFGLTNPEDTVSGRDVLENVGVLPKNKPGFFNSLGDSAGDVAGLATEVVADPLFWLTGPLGTVTKAGKAAEAAAKASKRFAGSEAFVDAATQAAKRLEPTAAGKVAPLGQIESPASLIEGLEQGTRSLFGLTKNPLKRGADVTLADLPGGRTIDQAAAKALKAIHYGLGDPITKALSAPIRHTRRLYDVSAQGLVRTVEQFLGDKSFRTYRRLEGVMDDFAPTAFARENELVEQFKDIASNAKTPGDEAAYNNMARYLFEMPYFKTVKDVKDHVDFQFGAAATPEAIAARDKFSESFFEYMDNMFTVKNKLYDEAGRLGIDVSKLEDTDPFVAHLRRRTAGIDSDLIGRNKLYVRVPGGTKTMNDMATEPLLTAPTMRDMAAVSQTAGKATDLEVGAYVRAADRANEGRITSIDEASGIANVYFHNKKAGTAKTVPLKLKNLTRIEKDGAPVFKPIPQTQLASELKDRLRNHINPVTGQPEKLSDLGTIAEMQERLIWDGMARPELDKWHAFRLAQTTDPKAIVDLNKQYDQVVDEWTKGYDILDKDGNVTRMRPKTEQFREYFDKQPAEIRLSGMYPRQILEDQTEYIKTTMSYVATMREVHNLMREKGVLTTSEEGAVPLAKAWKDAGYKPEGLKTFADENEDILKGLGGVDPAQLNINEKAADALKAYKRVMTPKNDKVFLELIDPVVNMYRFGLTVPFPAFHVRNRFSGVMQSMMETPEVSLRALTKGSDETWKHMLGKKELPGDFLDFVTTADLMKGNMGKEFGAKAVTGIPKQGLIEGLVGPWRGITKKNWRTKLNPMNTPGFRPPSELGDAVSQNVLAEMTNNAMNFVETLNRVGYAKALWDKGYSPSDIINHVRRSQFDYGELTQFEQNVMRRVVPFWTWTKKNLPYQLKKLAEQPGGATAQTIRGLTSRDEDQTYIPSFLRERNAFLAPQGLPDWLGGEKGPTDTTFVTQTGVPVEDFNKFISEPGSGLLNRRTAQRLSSELHPLLGAALRQYSGTDPFTGRPLKHLRSTTDTILNPMGIPSLPEGTKQYADRIIQASPFSRLAGTMATAVDPRKSYPEKLLNLASGARFSTYDTEVERARDLEKAQEKVLGVRPEVWEFNSFFVPESFQGPQAEQSRQDVQTLRQLEKVRKMLQEKNAAKKQKNSR